MNHHKTTSGFISTSALLLAGILAVGGFLAVSLTAQQYPNLGATLLLTDTTSTIGTFRTNVNTSLANLNAAITDTTSSLGAFASLSSTTGNLIMGSSSNWTTLTVGSNGKLLTASSTARGGISWESAATGITSLNGLTGATQTFATSGINGLIISSGGTTHTFTNIGVTSLVAGSSTIVSNATGTVTIATRPYPCQFIAIYTTSTANSAATSTIADDFCIVDTTSTIRSVWVKNQTSNDSLTFNLYYGTSTPSNNATTTGLKKVFTSDQTFSNTSSTLLTPTGSSTPGLGNFIRIFPYNASSTEFTLTIWFDQN